MTPTQARAFLAVALKGGFSEAARSLGISQPTVTTQIKQIEKAHAVELFYRSGRGAVLTPTGETLLPHIRRMFGSFEEASTYLDEIQGMRRGHLRLGSYGPYDIVKLVALYTAKFPAVSISVDFFNSQTLTEKLRNCELDVALLGSIKHQPEFHALAFRYPPLVAIAPRVPPWIDRQSISVAELKHQTIVLREPGSTARAAHDTMFAKARVSPDRVIQFATREGVVNAVAEGIGLGTIFDEGILPHDRVVKLKITNKAVHSKVDIVCLADRRGNKLIASFFAVAQETLKRVVRKRG
jgi:LysR family transcriptional regulator, low CO2-responsive transcriptional regulator